MPEISNTYRVSDPHAVAAAAGAYGLDAGAVRAALLAVSVRVAERALRWISRHAWWVAQAPTWRVVRGDTGRAIEVSVTLRRAGDGGITIADLEVIP